MSRFATPSKTRVKNSSILENATMPQKPVQKEPLHRYGSGKALSGPSVKGSHEFYGIIVDGFIQNTKLVRSDSMQSLPVPTTKRPEISPRPDYSQRSKSPLNTSNALTNTTFNFAQTDNPRSTTPNRTFLEISSKNLSQLNRVNSSSNMSVLTAPSMNSSSNVNRPRSASSVSTRSYSSSVGGKGRNSGRAVSPMDRLNVLTARNSFLVEENKRIHGDHNENNENNENNDNDNESGVATLKSSASKGGYVKDMYINTKTMMTATPSPPVSRSGAQRSVSPASLTRSLAGFKNNPSFEHSPSTIHNIQLSHGTYRDVRKELRRENLQDFLYDTNTDKSVNGGIHTTLSNSNNGAAFGTVYNPCTALNAGFDPQVMARKRINNLQHLTTLMTNTVTEELNVHNTDRSDDLLLPLENLKSETIIDTKQALNGIIIDHNAALRSHLRVLKQVESQCIKNKKQLQAIEQVHSSLSDNQNKAVHDNTKLKQKLLLQLTQIEEFQQSGFNLPFALNTYFQREINNQNASNNNNMYRSTDTYKDTTMAKYRTEQILLQLHQKDLLHFYVQPDNTHDVDEDGVMRFEDSEHYVHDAHNINNNNDNRADWEQLNANTHAPVVDYEMERRKEQQAALLEQAAALKAQQKYMDAKYKIDFSVIDELNGLSLHNLAYPPVIKEMQPPKLTVAELKARRDARLKEKNKEQQSPQQQQQPHQRTLQQQQQAHYMQATSSSIEHTHKQDPAVQSNIIDSQPSPSGGRSVVKPVNMSQSAALLNRSNKDVTAESMTEQRLSHVEAQNAQLLAVYDKILQIQTAKQNVTKQQSHHGGDVNKPMSASKQAVDNSDFNVEVMKALSSDHSTADNLPPPPPPLLETVSATPTMSTKAATMLAQFRARKSKTNTPVNPTVDHIANTNTNTQQRVNDIEETDRTPSPERKSVSEDYVTEQQSAVHAHTSTHSSRSPPRWNYSGPRPPQNYANSSININHIQLESSISPSVTPNKEVYVVKKNRSRSRSPIGSNNMSGNNSVATTLTSNSAYSHTVSSSVPKLQTLPHSPHHLISKDTSRHTSPSFNKRVEQVESDGPESPTVILAKVDYRKLNEIASFKSQYAARRSPSKAPLPQQPLTMEVPSLSSSQSQDSRTSRSEGRSTPGKRLIHYTL